MNEEQKKAGAEPVELRFPTMLRKMWSGTEVQNWLDEQGPLYTRAARDSFQRRVQPWTQTCFGAEIAADVQERNHRFLEEALELVQACGATASEAHQLVDYVYGRPVGDKHQEVGGVMVTLAALCLAQALDMHAAGETELARIWTKVDQIRAKQAAKPKHSPLPAHPAPDLIRLDFINSDGREDSKMITHDEMRGKYASARAGLAWVPHAGVALTDAMHVLQQFNALITEREQELGGLSKEMQEIADQARALLAAEQPSEDKRDAVNTPSLTAPFAGIVPATAAERDVLAERSRQVEGEGWTPEHDDEHADGGLAKAAATYAMHGSGTNADWLLSYWWPWDALWWKPMDQRRSLVKAGALILAEIERLDRAAIAEGARA